VERSFRTMSIKNISGKDSDEVYGEGTVEHSGDFEIEDVPREPSDYRPHEHFVIKYKQRVEVTGDVIKEALSRGNIYYANGENRFVFITEICDVEFWVVVVMKPNESKHMVLTAYSPQLHNEGEKWGAE